MLRLWGQALYTIPRVDLAAVDPVTRWLILARVSVVVMTATSALIGGLLAVRGDVFDWSLLILTALGLVLADHPKSLDRHARNVVDIASIPPHRFTEVLVS